MGVFLVADGACAGVGCSVFVFLSVGWKPAVNIFLNAEPVGWVKTRKRQLMGPPVDVSDGGVTPVVFFVEAL